MASGSSTRRPIRPAASNRQASICCVTRDACGCVTGTTCRISSGRRWTACGAESDDCACVSDAPRLSGLACAEHTRAGGFVRDAPVLRVHPWPSAAADRRSSPPLQPGLRLRGPMRLVFSGRFGFRPLHSGRLEVSGVVPGSASRASGSAMRCPAGSSGCRNTRIRTSFRTWLRRPRSGSSSARRLQSTRPGRFFQSDRCGSGSSLRAPPEWGVSSCRFLIGVNAPQRARQA